MTICKFIASFGWEAGNMNSIFQLMYSKYIDYFLLSVLRDMATLLGNLSQEGESVCVIGVTVQDLLIASYQ